MESARAILGAIQAGDVDRARQIVDAELRSDPNSGLLLSLKVHVAHEQNDKKVVLATAEKAVLTSTKQSLRLFLIPILLEYHANALLNSAFERVNRQDPQDREVTEAWIECALQLGDLEAAQKALMASLRNAPDQRTATYQACLVMALNYFDQIRIVIPNMGDRREPSGIAKKTPTSSPNPTAKLFPTLAKRMLDKHLPVTSEQECYVGALVHRMESQSALVQFLLDNMSHVHGSLDLELLLLTTMEEMEDFAKLHEHAAVMIKTIDSAQIWSMLNRAAIGLGHDESPVAAIKGGPTTANELLAELEWVTNKKKPSGTILKTCWQRFQAKPGAFRLLAPYITQENISSLEMSLEEIGSIINLGKLRQSLGIPTFSDHEVRAILKLSQDAQLPLNKDGSLDHVNVWLKLYQQHVGRKKYVEKDYLFDSDALLMAASEVLRSSASDGSDFSRERAISILEHALAIDKYHFQVKLLLVILYKSLGLHTQAMRYFKEMDVKNVQIEGLGYFVNSRSATLAPHQSDGMIQLLTLLSRNIPDFGYYSAYTLSAQSFTEFRGLFDLGRRTRFSLSRALFAVDKFQLSRFTRAPTDVADLLAIEVGKLVDNRDFHTTFDDGRGPIAQAGIAALSIGPLPDAEYVRVFAEKELFIAKYRQKLAGRPSSELPKFAASDLPLSLTDIEKWSLKVIEAIGKSLTEASSSLPLVPAPPQGPLDWRFYHWANTIIEVIRVCKQLRFTRIDNSGLRKLVREQISKHQIASSAYESHAVKYLNAQGIPGNAPRLVRTIKQQQLDLLKLVADDIKNGN